MVNAAMRKILLTALLMFPAPLLAEEAWCLTSDAIESCRYSSAEACYEISVTQGGNCAPNPRRRGEAGSSPFCVLTDSLRDCSYRSRRRCLDTAREKNGGCVRNVQLDLERRALGQQSIDESLYEDF